MTIGENAMNKLTILAISFFCLSMLFSSCNQSTEPQVYEAEIISIDQLNSVPGFSWFPAESKSYVPNDSIVGEIKTAFNAKNRKIFIFVRPACSCDGTTKLFPRLMRVLEKAEIPQSAIVVYSMRSTIDTFLNTENLPQIKFLPTIHVKTDASLIATLADDKYDPGATNIANLIESKFLNTCLK